MKIAIVGTSKLSEVERGNAGQIIDCILDGLDDSDFIITGDAAGVDELVRTTCYEDKVKVSVHGAMYKNWKDFKERNKAIAEEADFVYCITTDIKTKNCYHCNRSGAYAHERTGGCWTLKYAKSLGKSGEVIVV